MGLRYDPQKDSKHGNLGRKNEHTLVQHSGPSLSNIPDLITDTGYLEHTIKYAIDCGVIDQWIVSRTRGFPPKEGIQEEGEKEQEEEEDDNDDDTVPDPNGIRSISERKYRTLVESADISEYGTLLESVRMS
ncbi:hypothetical protein Gotur_013394 [Gossypium turneri]